MNRTYAPRNAMTKYKKNKILAKFLCMSLLYIIITKNIPTT